MMGNRWFGLVVVGGMLAFALALFPRLPEMVPTHWNFAGEADARSPRFPGAFIPVGIGAGLWLLGLVLPRIDPRRERYESFESTYWLVINLTILFAAALEVVALGAALGWPIDVARVVPVGVGLLFVGIGNHLPRVKSNWWMGIRTPWTLSSERVWRRTHRVGGRVFVVAGLALILSALLPVGEWVIPVIVVGAALGPTVYSYLLWRREEGGGPGDAERKGAG